MSTSRRTFLAGGVAAAALGGGTWAWLRAQGYTEAPPLRGRSPAREPVAPLPSAPYPPRAQATLEALVEVLLPGDPAAGLPSGVEAGVVGFLMTASRDPILRPVRNDVLKLTRYLDQGGQSLRGVRFVELDPEARAAVVADAAADAEARGRFVPARALEASLRVSLEGYLGHPHHGGNADAKVWSALDIRMPRARAAHGHHHGGDE